MNKNITKELIDKFKAHTPSERSAVPEYGFFHDVMQEEYGIRMDEMTLEDWELFGISLKRITEWVINDIQGTCTGSIGGAYAAYGIDDMNVPIEYIADIDNETFCCPACGWWSYTGGACDNGCEYNEETEDWE